VPELSLTDVHAAYTCLLGGGSTSDNSATPAVVVAMALPEVDNQAGNLYLRYSSCSGAATAKAAFEAFIRSGSTVRVVYVSEQEFAAAQSLADAVMPFDDIGTASTAATGNTTTAADSDGAAAAIEAAEESDCSDMSCDAVHNCETTQDVAQQRSADTSSTTSSSSCNGTSSSTSSYVDSDNAGSSNSGEKRVRSSSRTSSASISSSSSITTSSSSSSSSEVQTAARDAAKLTAEARAAELLATMLQAKAAAKRKVAAAAAAATSEVHAQDPVSNSSGYSYRRIMPCLPLALQSECSTFVDGASSAAAAQVTVTAAAAVPAVKEPAQTDTEAAVQRALIEQGWQSPLPPAPALPKLIRNESYCEWLQQYE
jgi:hypothetical protein